MKKNNLLIALLLTGLGFVTYLAGEAGARAGAACPALTLLATSAASQPKAAGVAAPQWALKGLDAKSVKLSDFRGKVVLLNFWATWCPPCRREIPALVALQKQYRSKGLVVVGVAMDEGGAAVVRPFAKKMGINYPVVIGDQKTAAAYGGVNVVPTTFLIDRSGRIAHQQEGDADRAAFESQIKPLL